ncbi:MT-A70 family methyltransferase [Algimonas porphyrae]|uniref:DNA methyltransferase n=1 Tax=Algimonas porphyrae TaxID=1128113 RepID=A0ABQ5V2M6_9PROT|nr:MT-A70 family methyltransferase [Algimonas porphyrae]GLQ20482.1 DNA methyltransferase [Algimonas porphyrae]
MSDDYPFSDLPLFGFDLIMADPPWDFGCWSEKGEAKNAKSHYRCMSLDDIRTLPVGELASKNCLLWLWATNPMLDQAFEVIRAWGFQFKTAGTWVKRTRHGKLGFGTGYVLRSANEPFLLATVSDANVPFLIATTGEISTARNVRSVIEGPVREHSRKPDEAFAAAEQLIPRARRLELFSRQARPGWTVWGDQADKFNEVDA